MNDPMIAGTAVCLAFILGLTVTRRIQGTVITMPMIYVTLGLLLSPIGLDLVHFDVRGEFVKITAELTLVLVLASDASRIRLRSLREYHTIPIRLLSIGLPLMIFVGGLIAVLMFGRSFFWESVLLAIVLTPTDAGLGQAIVTNPAVPARIRQALNIESGLNDGLAMPFLLLAITMLPEVEQSYRLAGWASIALLGIVVGAFVGIVVGIAGGFLIEWGADRRWMTKNAQRIAGIVLAILAYTLAEALSGNGFIAAFCMGIAVANATPSRLNDMLHEFSEIEVEIFMGLTFMVVFGATMMPDVFRNGITWSMIIYALLSLVFVRPVTVAISQIRERLNPLTVLFMGWFGPRGIASILYIFIILETKHDRIDTIYGTALLTIFISVFVHGITAAPGAKWYGKQVAAKVDADANEMQKVPELPWRFHSFRPK